MRDLIFLKVDFYLFTIAIYVFLVLTLLLFIFILGFTIYKRKIEYNKKVWQQSIAPVISEAIFKEDEEEEEYVDLLYITYKIEMLLQNLKFRNFVINELAEVKKSLSGASDSNLKKLFEALELDKDAFKKLNKIKWHIKAKGIEELGIMDQKKYTKEIFWLTNNDNEQ